VVKAPSKKQKKTTQKKRMEPPFFFASYQRKIDHSLKADLEIIGTEPIISKCLGEHPVFILLH
jgi:hypothetical protein